MKMKIKVENMGKQRKFQKDDKYVKYIVYGTLEVYDTIKQFDCRLTYRS